MPRPLFRDVTATAAYELNTLMNDPGHVWGPADKPSGNIRYNAYNDVNTRPHKDGSLPFLSRSLASHP